MQSESVTDVTFPESNQDFLLEIFGEGTQVWTRNSRAAPDSNRSKVFAGGKFQPLPLMEASDPTESNTYFCISTFRPNPNNNNAIQRQKSLFVGCYVIVIDDVGGRGTTLEEVRNTLEPTYAIETSPDNYQVGYVLSTPCTDINRADRTIARLNNAVGDAGAKGVERVARLPYGLNTKDKHKVDGVSPVVKQTLWTGRRIAIEDIERAFGTNVIRPAMFAGSKPDYAGNGRGNEEVGEDDLPEVLTWTQVRNLYQTVHPNENLSIHFADHMSDYEWWMTGGRALRHYVTTSLEGTAADIAKGKELWLEWSAKSAYWQAKPDEAENEAYGKWEKQFDREAATGKITTFGTLIKAVQLNDAANDVETPVGDIIDGVVVEALGIRERFAYHMGNDTVIDLTAPLAAAEIKLTAWERGHAISSKTSKRFQMDKSKVVINLDGFDPSKGRVYEVQRGNSKITYLNKYEECYHPKVTADTSFIWDHFKFLIPIADEYDVFMKRMAWIIQNPGKRPSWATLQIAAAHGMGRSFIHYLYKHLLGPDVCGTVKLKDAIDGDYQDWAYNKQHVFVHETKQPNSTAYTVGEELRELIDSANMHMNLKYGSNGNYDLYWALDMASNHEDALVIPSGDRRIMVIRNPDEPKDESYYEHLYRLVPQETSAGTPDVCHALYWELKGMDLAGWHPRGRAPDTEAKQRMIMLNTNYTEHALNSLLKDAHTGAIPHAGTMEDIRRLAERQYFEGAPGTFNMDQFNKLCKARTMQWQGPKDEGSSRNPRMKIGGSQTKWAITILSARSDSKGSRGPYGPRDEVRKAANDLHKLANNVATDSDLDDF